MGLGLSRIDDMQQQLNRMQKRLNQLRIDLRRERKQQQRIVQVSYVTQTTLLPARWDYIDGIGDLEIGDKVWAPMRFGVNMAIVVGIGKGQDYEGRLDTITRRRKSG